MQFRLIQKIVHLPTGQEFDLGYLAEATLVETMDLSGPKLILRFRDPFLYLADALKLQSEDTIRVTLADAFDFDGMDAVMDFTLLCAPDAGGQMVLNCLGTPVFNAKKPLARPRLFSRRPMGQVVRELVPGLKQDLAKAPIVEDYHILSGERPTYALRQMAREAGGHIFLDRDRMAFKRLRELMAGSATLTYHHNDNRKELQVITYQVRKPDMILKDRLKRSYAGWDITKGWVTSDVNSGQVFRLHASPARPILDALNEVRVPVLDCTMTGNGAIRAGSVLDIVWNTKRQDAPLNEALAGRVVVWSVAHYASDGKYFCRIKGCTPMETT
jgi:hypothetical protein